VGCQFEKKSLYSDANDIFRAVVSDYNENQIAKYAAAKLLSLEIVPAIEQLSEQELTASIAAMPNKAITKTPEIAALGVFFVAEAYYETGMRRSPSEADLANKFFAISAALMELHVFGKLPVSENAASAYYQAGLAYDRLGQYVKAAAAFRNACQADPTHLYADYSLFAQAGCYEKLLNEKQISETDAKSLMTTAYSQLLTKYPKSQYAAKANRWLQNK
jgi:TolA-binding protein